MVAYPGIGSFEGMLGWSQEGQYEAEMQAAAERYEPIYAAFAAWTSKRSRTSRRA